MGRASTATAAADGTPAAMDDTAAMDDATTMVDATAAAAIRSIGARAAATTLRPAVPRADMANPAAAAPATVVDASTSISSERGT